MLGVIALTWSTHSGLVTFMLLFTWFFNSSIILFLQFKQQQCIMLCTDLSYWRHVQIFSHPYYCLSNSFLSLCSRNHNHDYYFSSLSTYCNACFLVPCSPRATCVVLNFRIVPFAVQLIQTHPFASAYNTNLLNYTSE